LIAISSALWLFSKFGPPTQRENVFMKTTIKERDIIAQTFPCLQMLLGDYYAKNGHYPAKLEELKYMKSYIAQLIPHIAKDNIESLLKDPYTKPSESLLHYSTNESYSKCSITSVGGDRLNGTADDITIIFEQGGLGEIKCNPREHQYLDKFAKGMQNK